MVRLSWKLAAIAVTAVLALQLQGVKAQGEVLTATLFSTYNLTSAQYGYSSCNDVGAAPMGVTNSLLNETQLAGIQVNSVWFNVPISSASSFNVINNCSVLQLNEPNGYGTTIYTGPVPLKPDGCTVDSYASETYVTVVTNITDTGYWWSISLPTVTTLRAQTSCNGGYEYCPLATAVPCSQALSFDYVLPADGQNALSATQG